MTDIRKAADPLTYLDEVDARAEAATPGPWEVDVNTPFSLDLVGIFAPNERGYAVKFDHVQQPPRATAKFIAHARQDLPALSKALRAVFAIHPREVIAVHEGYGEEAWCPRCKEHYPCETVQAIQAALAVNNEGGK